MANGHKILVIDLDGTLCEQTGGGEAYFTASPRRDVIAKVNQCHAAGWEIVIHTARGMKTYSGDRVLIEHVYRRRTMKWLEDHGVQYDRLMFGKPAGDIYIDDKGMSVDDFLKPV